MQEILAEISLHKEGQYWVAVCRKYDIAGHGVKEDDAIYQVSRMIAAHCFGGGLKVVGTNTFTHGPYYLSTTHKWSLISDPVGKNPETPELTLRLDVTKS